VVAGADQGHEVPIHGEVNTISGGFPRKECARAAVESRQTNSAPDVDLVFSQADLQGVIPHDYDAMVISLIAAGRRVHHVLVDQGSSADVMFLTTFNRLRLSMDQLKPYVRRLYGLTGNEVEVHGYVELSTTFTDNLSSRTTNIRYLVVYAPSAYNILLGRPTLNRLGAVPFIRHMKMKLRSLEGTVITIVSDQKEAKKCYENCLKTRGGIFSITSKPPREDGVTREEIVRENRPEVAEGVVEKEIGGKIFKLGQSLSGELWNQISEVIARHLDAFAWSAADMSDIDPDFQCHHLTMDPSVRPVRQSRQKFNEEKRQVIWEETEKLLKAGHIKEIQYSEWLANVVLVKKANGKWRMCVDFTDLNKACPKDSYPLPSIDALVDRDSWCMLLNFLDAFSATTRS